MILFQEDAPIVDVEDEKDGEDDDDEDDEDEVGGIFYFSPCSLWLQISLLDWFLEFMLMILLVWRVRRDGR